MLNAHKLRLRLTYGVAGRGRNCGNRVSVDDMCLPSTTLTTTEVVTAGCSGYCRFTYEKPRLPQFILPNNCGTFLPTLGFRSGIEMMDNFLALGAKIGQEQQESALVILSEERKRKQAEKKVAEQQALLDQAWVNITDFERMLTEKDEQIENLKSRLAAKSRTLKKYDAIVESIRRVHDDSLSTEGDSEAGFEEHVENERNGNRSQGLIPSHSRNGSQEWQKLKGKTANHGIDITQSAEGFQCICGLVLKTRRTLISHIQRYDTTFYHFSCRRCSTRFCRTSELKRHMMDKHKLIYSRYGCRTCGATYKTGLELMRHRRIKHDVRRACKGQSKSRSGQQKSVSLNIKHSRARTNDPDKLVCTCGKMCLTRKGFNLHLRHFQHNNVKKDNGSKRQEEATVEVQSQRHGSASATSTRETVRCLCGIRFENRSELVKHLQEYSPK